MQRRQLLATLASLPLWCRSVRAAPQLDEIPGAPSSAAYPYASAYLRSLIADEQFAGAVMLICRRGQPDYVDVTGWLDGQQQTLMARDSLFFLASLSKPITGVATLILVEQGKLKLDDPIDRWLPELANRKVLRKPDGPLDDTYASPRPITVADLLAFRCGYGSNGGPGPFAAALRAAGTPINGANSVVTLTNEAFLKALSSIPLQYAPGERWLYDTPADILSVLIARVTGQKYSAFLKQHIYEPLGMKDTAFFVPPEKAVRVAQYPGGTRGDTALLVEPQFESGAHGINSTADDYMRFTRMLLNRGELNGVRILKPETIEAMRIDRLSPAEHKAGGFLDRYPGRGYGWCGAVRLEPLPFGPSVGSYNWAGGSGVWMMVDYARDMATVIMVQHPTGGPGAGPEQPVSREALAQQTAAPAPKKYLAQTVWNDLMQTEIYKSVV